MTQQNIEGQLREFLNSQGNIELAILFGSLAFNKANAESDLDIALLFKQPMSSTTRIALINQLSERFGRPVDLIDLHTVGEPLLGQILKGQRLLGNNSTYAQLISKHLLDAADFLPLQQRILKERREAWINS